jgi:hypothetical protein
MVGCAINYPSVVYREGNCGVQVRGPWEHARHAQWIRLISGRCADEIKGRRIDSQNLERIAKRRNRKQVFAVDGIMQSKAESRVEHLQLVPLTVGNKHKPTIGCDCSLAPRGIHSTGDWKAPSSLKLDLTKNVRRSIVNARTASFPVPQKYFGAISASCRSARVSDIGVAAWSQSIRIVIPLKDTYREISSGNDKDCSVGCDYGPLRLNVLGNST